jgi:hypothetical protein
MIGWRMNAICVTHMATNTILKEKASTKYWGPPSHRRPLTYHDHVNGRLRFYHMMPFRAP